MSKTTDTPTSSQRTRASLLRRLRDWDDVRDAPEFKALLADPKNSEPL